jgi:proteasome lid subunit RPN8/RPN11
MYDAPLLEEIKASFSLKKEEESCGLIIKNNDSYQFIPCKNTAKDRVNNFIIDPLDYLKASRIGDIDCCVHSHIKDVSFSNEDINNSFNNNLNYLLYNIKKDRFYFFDIKKYRSYQKYTNLDFRLGKSDCASLIYDFYKQHLNIEVPTRPIIGDCNSYEELKNKNLHIWNDNLYKDNINMFYIFKPKTFEDLKAFDIIVFDHPKEKIPVHGAIYIDNELILHQMQESPSRIETMRKGHFKFINYAARYKLNL